MPHSVGRPSARIQRKENLRQVHQAEQTTVGDQDEASESRLWDPLQPSPLQPATASTGPVGSFLGRKVLGLKFFEKL